MVPDGYGLELLFSNGDLVAALQSEEALAIAEVDQLDATTLLNDSPEASVDRVVESHRAAPVVLIEPTVETVEKKVDARYLPNRAVWDEGRPVWVDGTLVRIQIGFSGDGALFGLRPPAYDLNPPRGRLVDNALIIDCAWADVPAVDDVKRWIEGQIATLRRWLEWQDPTVAQYNERLQTNVRERIYKRRHTELARRSLLAALPYTIHRRHDAPLTYVPANPRRKRIVPEILEGASDKIRAFVPEPALTDEQFGEIMAIIRAIGRSMERMPDAFDGLTEESLRAIFLAALNAQFEGNATGETFNYSGKTDLLIRDENRNLLIGECKIWQGPRTFRGGENERGVIDQLLGYVAWRDARAAVLLFVRGKDFTHVLTQIVGLVQAHPNVRGAVRQIGETEWHCRVAQQDDAQRELTLAITAFHFPSTVRSA
jgi:hypothetical protein